MNIFFPKEKYLKELKLIKETIEWSPATIISTHEIPLTAKLINSLTPNYQLLPSDEHGSSKITVSVLQFLDNIVVSLKPLKIGWPSSGAQMVVESAPFALVNPAVFLGYLSSGTINYVSTVLGSYGVPLPVAILTDMKFLEGMEGGIAYDNKNCILGLVAGCLQKCTKEGSMTVIVPFDLIVEAISSVVRVPVSDSGVIRTREPAFHGVATVLVDKPGGVRMWGSGMLLDTNTLVTNLHVVKDHRKITIWFSKWDKVEARFAGAPIKGLDLAFLNLAQPCELKSVEISNKTPVPGTKVRSIGYGIFYPHGMGSTVEPLHSEGIISKVIHLPLTTDSKARPAMMISSAGCWNGSSGGGVFDVSDGRLLGMMTSNGRSERGGEIIPEMAFVIPSNLIQRGWSLLRETKTLTVSDRVFKLWELQETHKSIAKTKL
jgi:S1-C subfamily serine protease